VASTNPVQKLTGEPCAYHGEKKLGAEQLTWWKQRIGEPAAHGIAGRVSRLALTETNKEKEELN